MRLAFAALATAVTVALSGPVAAAAPGTDMPRASAASCSVAGARIYHRYGVSCHAAKRVLRRFLSYRSPGSGWSCSRHHCDGSGLSIDAFRGFSFR